MWIPADENSYWALSPLNRLYSSSVKVYGSSAAISIMCVSFVFLNENFMLVISKYGELAVGQFFNEKYDSFL